LRKKHQREDHGENLNEIRSREQKKSQCTSRSRNRPIERTGKEAAEENNALSEKILLAAGGEIEKVRKK